MYTKEKRSERIESWKELANFLLGSKVYVKDLNEEYYLGILASCNNNYIEVTCFAPQHKAGKKFLIYWLNVYKFDSYKEDM